MEYSKKFSWNLFVLLLLLIVFVLYCFNISPPFEKIVKIVPLVYNEDNNACIDENLRDYPVIFKKNNYAEIFKQFHIPRLNLSSDLINRTKHMPPFEIQTTLSERHLMYNLLETFDKFMNNHGIPYVLYGGTLLGSFRHHDIIPWDEDIDLWVSVSDRPRLRTSIETLKPDYILAKAGPHDKFHHKDGKKAGKFWWFWPYVDISYFDENATHVWNIGKVYGRYYYFPKSIMYPYKRRPLYNLSLPAPKDTFALLIWLYGFGGTCAQLGYSHMVEGRVSRARKECSELRERYPFVEHKRNAAGEIVESLTFKDKVLTTYITDEPSYAVAHTFNIELKEGFKIPSDIPLP